MPNKFQGQNKKSKLIESAITKIVRKIINESMSNVNLEQPISNLYIKGWGVDKNGNMRIVVGFPNDKGFSIQTNGVLPKTHQMLGYSPKAFTDIELETIGKEITQYVQQHGSTAVKSRLKIYNQK